MALVTLPEAYKINFNTLFFARVDSASTPSITVSGVTVEIPAQRRKQMVINTNGTIAFSGESGSFGNYISGGFTYISAS